MKLSELIGINKWIQLHKNAINGWWYTYPSERMKVSWGYYSQYMEKQKMFQTTNQITLMKMSELIGIDLLIQLHKNWGLYLVSNFTTIWL
jgi:hypothetical protein